LADTTIPPALLLCDWAEEIQGKLYIQGAGWSRIDATGPMQFAVAVLWQVPWGQANHPHDLELKLVTEDGAEATGPEGNPIKIAGKVEVGRPAGSKQGSFQGFSLAVKFAGLTLPPGGYRFELSINGSMEAFAPFQAIGGTA